MCLINKNTLIELFAVSFLGYIPVAVPGTRRTVKGQDCALTAAVKSHVKSSAVSEAEMFHSSVSNVLSSESSTDRGRPAITGGFE